MATRQGCRGLLKHLSDYIDGESEEEICRLIRTHSPKCRPCKNFIATLRKSVSILAKTGKRASAPPRLRRDLRRKLAECAKSLKKA